MRNLFLIFILKLARANFIFDIFDSKNKLFLKKYSCSEIVKVFKYFVCEKSNKIFSSQHFRELARFDPMVYNFELDAKIPLVPRFMYNDPNYKHISFLSGEFLSKGSKNLITLNLSNIWKQGITGKGINVAILEGLDIEHPDLKDNIDLETSYDFTRRTKNILRGTYNDSQHGTMCAGIIAARANNSKCIVGVAYDAKISVLKDVGDYVGVKTNRLLRSLSHQNDKIHIYSSSWGVPDTGVFYLGMSNILRNVITSNGLKGRSGYGSIYVWAAGNGGYNFDSCAYDSILQHPSVFAINSIDMHGNIPNYIEKCTAILATTISSATLEFDSLLYGLKYGGGCAKVTGGTSAAAPEFAGIVSLLLSLKNDLHRRDIEEIVVRNSRQMDPNAVLNGAGLRYSTLYGYGLVQPNEMIEAVKYFSVPKSIQKECKTQKFLINASSRRKKIRSQIYTSGCLNETYMVDSLEIVVVKLNLRSERRNSFEIYLTSSSGTKIKILESRRLDNSKKGLSDFEIKVMAFYGEKVAGIWELEVECESGVKTTLIDWKLKFFGTKISKYEAVNKHSRIKTRVCKTSKFKKDKNLQTWCRKHPSNRPRKLNDGKDIFSYNDKKKCFPNVLRNKLKL